MEKKINEQEMLCEGWKRIDRGALPPSVNWEACPEVRGVLVEKKEVEWQGTKRRLIVLNTGKSEVTIWLTRRLDPLWEVDYGSDVYIINKGWTQSRTGRRVRDFEVWVKP